MPFLSMEHQLVVHFIPDAQSAQFLLFFFLRTGSSLLLLCCYRNGASHQPVAQISKANVLSVTIRLPPPPFLNDGTGINNY